MSFAKAAAAEIVKCGADEDRKRKLKKVLLAIAGIGGIAGLGGLAYANRHTLFPSLTKSDTSVSNVLDRATPYAAAGAALGPAAANIYKGLPGNLPGTNSRQTLGEVATRLINNPSQTRERNMLENLRHGARNEDFHAAIQPNDNPLKDAASGPTTTQGGAVLRPDTTVGHAIKALQMTPTNAMHADDAALLARLKAIAGPRNARFQPMAMGGRALMTGGIGYGLSRLLEP